MDKQYQKIGVYLSSKSGLPAAYQQAAREVGALIGRTGRTLVYGGARKGLMEILAQSVRAHGGRVYGMVPDILVERGLVSDAIDVTFRCVDLSDRKDMMNRESDLLVALPGGIGTLDELFTALATATIGIGRMPVVLYNAGGCWDSLLETLGRLKDDGLISEDFSELFAVVDDVEDLERLLA